jgi:hypothetical protein
MNPSEVLLEIDIFLDLETQMIKVNLTKLFNLHNKTKTKNKNKKRIYKKILEYFAYFGKLNKNLRSP